MPCCLSTIRAFGLNRKGQWVLWDFRGGDDSNTSTAVLRLIEEFCDVALPGLDLARLLRNQDVIAIEEIKKQNYNWEIKMCINFIIGQHPPVGQAGDAIGQVGSGQEGYPAGAQATREAQRIPVQTGTVPPVPPPSDHDMPPAAHHVQNVQQNVLQQQQQQLGQQQQAQAQQQQLFQQQQQQLQMQQQQGQQVGQLQVGYQQQNPQERLLFNDASASSSSSRSAESQNIVQQKSQIQVDMTSASSSSSCRAESQNLVQQKGKREVDLFTSTWICDFCLHHWPEEQSKCTACDFERSVCQKKVPTSAADHMNVQQNVLQQQQLMQEQQQMQRQQKMQRQQEMQRQKASLAEAQILLPSDTMGANKLTFDDSKEILVAEFNEGISICVPCLFRIKV